MIVLITVFLMAAFVVGFSMDWKWVSVPSLFLLGVTILLFVWFEKKSFTSDQIVQLRNESDCVKQRLLESTFNSEGLRKAKSQCKKDEENQRKFELLK